MAKARTPDPTTLDADYYPRMKIHRRWYLIVPEMEPPSHSPHEGCAFYRPEQEKEDNGTIFVTPSKFPEYRAHLVVNKLEGNV